MRRSILWVPFLLLGAMIYWSVALGLGGLSFATLGSRDAPVGNEGSGGGDDAIVVRLATPEEHSGMPIIRGANVDPGMMAPPPRDSVGRTAY